MTIRFTAYEKKYLGVSLIGWIDIEWPINLKWMIYMHTIFAISFDTTFIQKVIKMHPIYWYYE